MLSTDVTVDRPDTHEVVPASDGKTGDVHLVKEPGAVLVGPVTVVGWMSKPFSQQLAILLRDSRHLVERLESFRASRAADAVSLVKQTQARIDHVLCGQMWRTSHRQKILCKSRLRTAERPDFAGRPGLGAQPFDQIVTIFAFTPAERSITAPVSFGLL